MRQGGFGGGRSFGGGGGGFEQKAAPVKVGEEVDVVIDAVGAKGDGIAKIEGFVIFVPNTKTGDNVKIRVTKVLANMAFAEVAGQAVGGESSQRKARRDDAAEYAAKASETVEQPVDTEDFGEES